MLACVRRLQEKLWTLMRFERSALVENSKTGSRTQGGAEHGGGASSGRIFLFKEKMISLRWAP